MFDKDVIKTLKLHCNDLVFKEIDWEKIIDNKILNLNTPSFFRRAIDKLVLKKETDYYSIILEKILNLRKKIKSLFGTNNDGQVRFLLRVDDFPRFGVESEMFYEFHNILKRNNIPYLLAVTPKPGNRELTLSEVNILKDISKDKVEFALHGFTHQIKNKNIKSEIIGMKESEIHKEINNNLEYLKDFNINVFVPPFNSIDLKSYKIISQKFKCICGGRETIKYLGFWFTPCFLMNSLYVPSYYPVYGKANEILEYIVNKLNKIKENIIVPLTLHWTWEIKNNFKHTELLIESIKDKVIAWNKFLKTAIDIL